MKRDTAEPWCYEATRDKSVTTRTHCDDNPLWCDPKYAATTSTRHQSRYQIPV